jgi:hypothetical protein
MRDFWTSDAAVQYAWIGLRARFARVRSGDLDRGASAVEWVVISMIVVGIVATVGYFISLALTGRAKSVSDCIGSANGSQQGC